MHHLRRVDRRDPRLTHPLERRPLSTKELRHKGLKILGQDGDGILWVDCIHAPDRLGLPGVLVPHQGRDRMSALPDGVSAPTGRWQGEP